MQRFSVRLRRGMTLIELLVVIGIIATLAAVTIPIMVPAVESRRMREAARGVSTFISAARARAVELNRPVGIHFQPLENEAGASMAMFYVEQPPAFAGSSVNAKGTIAIGDRNDGVLNLSFPPLDVPVDLVRQHDLMKLNYQGHWYRITGVHSSDGASVNSVDLVPVGGSGVMPWQEDGTEQVSYQIYRQPVPSAGQPYQLPDGIVIDLVWSGPDGVSYPAPNVRYLREITFSPSGHVLRVRWSNPNSMPERPTGAIYLLVGKRENVDASATVTNWADPNTLWITINHQTGQSKAVENVTDAADVVRARDFARDQMALGGR